MMVLPILLAALFLLLLQLPVILLAGILWPVMPILSIALAILPWLVVFLWFLTRADK